MAEKLEIPQSHLSKIESGQVDVKLSSLIEFTRVLDLELVLVPRQLVPMVQSILLSSEIQKTTTHTLPAYRLNDDDNDNDGEESDNG